MKEPTDYELWKSGYKISLRAFTEEEMFNFGFEAGRQLGMRQEKALWELAQSTQELEEKPKKGKK